MNVNNIFIVDNLAVIPSLKSGCPHSYTFEKYWFLLAKPHLYTYPQPRLLLLLKKYNHSFTDHRKELYTIHENHISKTFPAERNQYRTESGFFKNNHADPGMYSD